MGNAGPTCCCADSAGDGTQEVVLEGDATLCLSGDVEQMVRQISENVPPPLVTEEQLVRRINSHKKSEKGGTMTLRKPFFKDWEHVMSYDLAAKHKMPITLGEFALCKEKSQEGMEGWDKVVDSKDIILSKMMNGARLSLRAFATVPGVEALAAFLVYYKMEERRKWDNECAEMKVLQDPQDLVAGAYIVYRKEKKVPFMPQRDGVVRSRARILEDGSIMIAFRSAVHDDAPKINNITRTETSLSCYLFRQTLDANSNPVLNLFLLTTIEADVPIPKMFINFILPKIYRKHVDDMRKAALAYQKEHPGYEESVREELDELADSTFRPCDFEAACDVPPREVAV